MNRQDVSFLSRGVRCHAWLYRPPGESRAPRARPAIVLAHGLGGTKAMRLDAYAERFTAAGYVCVVFDYRHFGDSAGAPRQLLSVRKQLADWEAAIAFARELDGVDPERVVAWGTSFGGGHALSMARRDSRLAAAIAQCPFTDGLASTMAVDTRTGLKVTGAALHDRVGAALRRAPRYLPNAAPPGTASFMNAADALPGMLAIGADADANRLTARSALDILRYAPGRGAQHIAIPIFVALCDPDTVAPDRPAERQVRRAPRAEIRRYPVGHFDIYLGDPFERAVADYLDFLHRHVPA